MKFSSILTILLLTIAPVSVKCQGVQQFERVYAQGDRATEDLRAHGIDTSESSLIQLLERGLMTYNNLPSSPEEKSQLAVDAIAKLAAMRSQASVPVLTRIAQLDSSVGAFKIVESDITRTAPTGREQFRVRAYRLLQYNAVNALGIIGDHGSLPLVRSILQSEQDVGAIIQYSLCLALLGDASGVDNLVTLIQRQNRRESAAAARVFYIITGQDFGYTDFTALRARKAKAEQYRRWWAEHRSRFRPNQEDIQSRRLTPDPSILFTPRSTRDRLKVAARYFDFQNRIKSVEVRESLKQAGTALNPEYERIAQDPMEDLDVRMEAMNWYYEVNRDQSEALFKRLRKDENPEIVDKAQTLLDQMESKDSVVIFPSAN